MMTPEQRDKYVADRVVGRILAKEAVEMITLNREGLVGQSLQAFEEYLHKHTGGIVTKEVPVKVVPMTDAEVDRFDKTRMPWINTRGDLIQNMTYLELDKLEEMRSWFDELNRYLRSDKIKDERKREDHDVS